MTHAPRRPGYLEETGTESHDDILCLGEGKDGFLTLGFQPHYVSFYAHFLSVRVFCWFVGLFFR